MSVMSTLDAVSNSQGHTEIQNFMHLQAISYTVEAFCCTLMLLASPDGIHVQLAVLVYTCVTWAVQFLNIQVTI